MNGKTTTDERCGAYFTGGRQCSAPATVFPPRQPGAFTSSCYCAKHAPAFAKASTITAAALANTDEGKE